MPSAAPVPRGPSVLALGGVGELLTRPGCPACRYAAEASDRYLAWFALEGHADPVTITRLCASLGMCAPHTRQLMGQPGAAARLTAVYRYLLQAAREQLGRPGRHRLADCPACEHDQAAAGRALDTLLDGLPETGVWERYVQVGGLCWPHVRAAASLRGHRHALARIAQAMAASTAGQRTSLDMLAGSPDHDAQERARLRAALPPAGRLVPGACPACLTAAQAELTGLTGLARAGLPRAAGAGHRRREGALEAAIEATAEDAAGAASRQAGCLCAGHLRDMALMHDGHDGAPLGWEAEGQAAVLARLAQPPAWRRGGHPASWLGGRHPPAGGGECPVCRASERGAQRELERHRVALKAARALPASGARPASRPGQELCVRHVLAVLASDPAAGRLAADDAVRHGGDLIGELTEAFRKGTWAFRHESRGVEMTAWRRAAAFLDGGVFGGGPPA